MVKLVTAFLCGVAVLGCSKLSDTHPVSWYVAHAGEMQSKVAWCLNDADRRQSSDCQNAEEAKRRSLMGSQKALAPIDWGPAKSTH